MSKRELTALLGDNLIRIISSTHSGRSRAMEDGHSDRKRLGQLKLKLADLQQLVTHKDQELEWQGSFEVAREATHVHKRHDVTCKGKARQEDDNVTSGPATRTETAAILEPRSKSGDGSP